MFLFLYSHFLFEIILFLLEKYINYFQIFITIVVKHVMEFLHLLFEILIFSFEKI
jgi:hypothetical protein